MWGDPRKLPFRSFRVSLPQHANPCPWGGGAFRLSATGRICDTSAMKHPPTIFFSAGEPSGDIHGANLIRQLREICPTVKAVGYGGPNMAAAGCQLYADLTALAVMWFARVLVNLHKFWDLASRADRYFRHHRPDAVVLIDYPGFNWWIARRAKVHGIPVYYYTPPQIWAWATWRVEKMRRLVDHAPCSLPFEEAWLRERGCKATYVGHPFFDEVRRRPLDKDFLISRGLEKENRSQLPEQPLPISRGREKTAPGVQPLVLILPGSRTQEILHNLRLVPGGGGADSPGGSRRAIRSRGPAGSPCRNGAGDRREA